jgi:drug/metabolite transporter (DMT)-like permease
MDHSWLFLAMLAGISSQVFNFLNRYLLKDGDDPISFGWLAEFLRFSVYLFFLPFDFQFNNGLPTYYLLLALGFVNVLSVYVFFKMHSFAELSISSIVSRTRLIWVPIIAFLFLGEILHTEQYIGIAVLFFGLSITVSPRKIFADKGVMYSFLTSLVVAVISVLMKALSPVASTSMIMVCMALPTVMFLPLLMRNSLKRIKQEFTKNLKLKLTAAGANLLAMYLTIMALKQGGPVSIVSGIYQAMMIVSVIAGIIFLHERNNIGKKILGSIITVIGIVVLTTL